MRRPRIPRQLRWKGLRRRPRLPRAPRRWRKMALLALVAAAILGGRDGIGYLGASLSGDTGCRVTSVVDGDTVRLYCPGSGFETARLTGFDTPEIYSPSCADELWAGIVATWALRGRLSSAEEVRIVFHGTDRYDRRLAALFLDGRDVSRLMIEAGHARPYDGGRRQGWCA